MRGAKRQWRLSSTDRSGSGDRHRRNVKHEYHRRLRERKARSDRLSFIVMPPLGGMKVYYESPASGCIHGQARVAEYADIC